MQENEVIKDELTQPTEDALQNEGEILSEEEAGTEEATQKLTDYAALAEEDLCALKNEFPELISLNDISELENPLRYAALRDLGLSPAEAYLATARKRRADNRSHLNSSVPRASSFMGATISERELSAARELFPEMSDGEIRKLYRRVKK